MKKALQSLRAADRKYRQYQELPDSGLVMKKYENQSQNRSADEII
jgi:hypothetical protein